MPVTPSSPRHIVTIAYEAWGHNRPLCSFAAKIVKSSPLAIVTFITPERLYDQVKSEISRSFTDGDAEALSRIVVVGLDVGEPQEFTLALVDNAFRAMWPKFSRLQPVKCGKTGEEIVARSKPDAIVIDIFGADILDGIRSDAQQQGVPPPKTVAWLSCSLSAIHGFVYLNSEMTQESVARKSRESGKSLEEVMNEFVTPTGAVMRIPGLAPIYDYENYPQKPFLASMQSGKMCFNIGRMVREADHLMFSSPGCYESTAVLKYWAEHTEESGQGYHCVGPLIPFGEESLAIERQRSDPSHESMEFVERIMESFGPQSLTYVSFGSVWWAPETDKLWAFLATLIEMKRPFIMSHASPFAQIPERVTKMVKESGIGYMSNWVPQQAILNHPVMGWFVTHAGFNSVIESISAGIPMICWPFQADQPINTLHLTDNLGIAYELIAVRTNHLDKPIHRTGKPPQANLDDVREETMRVFGDAYGVAGSIKRKKLLKLREEITDCWSENGASQRDLSSFLAAI